MSRGVFNLSLAIRLGSRPSSSQQQRSESAHQIIMDPRYQPQITEIDEMSQRAIYKHNWPPLCEHHSQISPCSPLAV